MEGDELTHEGRKGTASGRTETGRERGGRCLDCDVDVDDDDDVEHHTKVNGIKKRRTRRLASISQITRQLCVF